VTRTSPVPAGPQANVWLTTADGKTLLGRRPPVALGAPGSTGLPVVVDDSRAYQRFLGVGAALTGSSAQLLDRLPPATRDHVLTRLFSPTRGIGLSVLRQPFGANDFSIGSHTYDDLPPGATDPSLAHFSLADDPTLVLPLLRRARQLNPSLAVVGTPWSAPAWMKTSHALIGGSLQLQFYDVYAHYLVRAVQDYAANGVPVNAITVQNEPSFSPPGYPGMTLDVQQQKDLIDQHLAPALAAANLHVGIWALDDDYSRAADAQSLLSDPATRADLAGVAFHCYLGDVSSMGALHAQFPNTELAISECTGGDWSRDFGSNLEWDMRTLLIDGIRNGATWITKWNTALDPSDGPTNGGCQNCRGLLTIDPGTGSVRYNEDYYALGQLGRFVVPGAHVIASTDYGAGSIDTVAFRNPDGSHVLVVLNSGGQARSFTVDDGGRGFAYTLPAGAVATFTW
jgi:glucosylceramidase